MSEARITEINQGTFWTLINQARAQPENPDQWLAEQLTAMGPEEAMMFAAFSDSYRSLANEYGLWTAAAVMDESCYSISGFSDFRTWLIGQGKEVYMAALADPDSLAGAPNYHVDKRDGGLALVGEKVYQKLAGGDALWVFGSRAQLALRDELKRGVAYGEGIGYPYDWPDVPAYLPGLCAKYLTGGHRARYSRAAIRFNTWNPDNPAIKAARRVAQKGKKGKGREQR